MREFSGEWLHSWNAIPSPWDTATPRNTMILCWRGILRRSPPGTLIAFLVLGFCAPGQARAGCDSPGVVGNVEKAPMPGHGLPPRAHSDSRPPAPVPCHGPTCSRQPAPAPINPIPVSHVQVDPWALLDAGWLLAAATPGTYVCAADPTAPIHRGGDIFHPPRLASLSSR